MELFRNSHDALVFAFNFSSQQYGLSEMARLAGPPAGSGKGLIGMDGAAQAGMILREVEALGDRKTGNPLLKASIVVLYSPKFKQCPCCQNDSMPLEDYREAIRLLRDESAAWISGLSLAHMREAVIRSYYEPGVSLKREAERLKVAKSTAYDHKSVIVARLKRLEEEARGILFPRLDKLLGFSTENTCTGKTVPA